MELRHLKYFVAVAEELNFSRAAERLFISQPALSRQIKDLENELSVVLFLTQSDGLRLTEAGQFFLAQAKDILNRSDVAVQNLKASYKMPPSEQVKALRDRTINIAFMGNPPDELDAEFTVKCVKKVPIYALLPDKHRLAHESSINLAELASEKFIGMSEETFPGRNDRIRDTCRCAGFMPNLQLFADSHASMIALVAAGQGVALMPQEAESLPHPQVVFMPLHHPIYYARSTAVWRTEKPTQSLDKYLQILFDYIQD